MLMAVDDSFEKYYKAQKIIADTEGEESEWRQFMKSLKTELPTTFRITGSKTCVRRPGNLADVADPAGLRTAQDLNDVVRNTYIPFLSGLHHQGEPVEPPEQIPW